MQLLCFPAAFFACLLFSVSLVDAAPSADLWPKWQDHSPGSTSSINHNAWDHLLQKYLITDHPSGINRFRYADVSPIDQENLASYIDMLEDVRVSALNRAEQKAYWINLYNSLTVKVILDHYPVQSITNIDISPGFFSNGPWDAKLLAIEKEKVSLNDIEHRILRPIFKDNRLHYALHCASLGCPNLQPVGFTSANTEALLEKGARDYINSPRGASMVKGKLQVSSIYKWFQEDFGGTEKGVTAHLKKYALEPLSITLQTYQKGLRFDDDWSLNEP